MRTGRKKLMMISRAEKNNLQIVIDKCQIPVIIVIGKCQKPAQWSKTNVSKLLWGGFMPRRDGRGPEGYGPRTGRGYGTCGDRARAGYAGRSNYRAGYRPVAVEGYGASYGQGYGPGFGPGFGAGYRAGFGAGFGAGHGKRFRAHAYNKYENETPEERLTRRKSYLEKKLEIVNKRLEEL